MSNEASNVHPSSEDSARCSRCQRQNQPVDLDYYWRDYIGLIPQDAIPGGSNIAHQTTYIGQGFYSRAGLLTGTIYPGISGIKVAYSGCNVTEIGLKILCSPLPVNFMWLKVEGKSLHVTTIGKHLVIGGYEDGKIINIGRAMYQGELIVGKVVGFDAEKTKLYFIHGDKEVGVSSFEVLVYG